MHFNPPLTLNLLRGISLDHYSIPECRRCYQPLTDPIYELNLSYNTNGLCCDCPEAAITQMEIA